MSTNHALYNSFTGKNCSIARGSIIEGKEELYNIIISCCSHLKSPCWRVDPLGGATIGNNVIVKGSSIISSNSQKIGLDNDQRRKNKKEGDCNSSEVDEEMGQPLASSTAKKKKKNPKKMVRYLPWILYKGSQILGVVLIAFLVGCCTLPWVALGGYTTLPLAFFFLFPLPFFFLVCALFSWRTTQTHAEGVYQDGDFKANRYTGILFYFVGWFLTGTTATIGTVVLRWVLTLGRVQPGHVYHTFGWLRFFFPPPLTFECPSF